MKNIKVVVLMVFLVMFSACVGSQDSGISDAVPDQLPIDPVSEERLSIDETSDTDEHNAFKSQGSLTVQNNNIDLGEIPISDGEVYAYFTLNNLSQEAVMLVNGKTSLEFLSASIMYEDKFSYIDNSEEENEAVSNDGAEFDSFDKYVETGLIMSSIPVNPAESGSIKDNDTMIGNLNMLIQPGEKVYIKAVFDPTFYAFDPLEENSLFLTFTTNSVLTPELKLRIKGSTVMSKVQRSSISFFESMYDFGIVKSSEGSVAHEIPFISNVPEPVEITGVVTGCGCLSAKVNKTHFKKGEEGIIIVTFNPNLYDLPDVRTYKMVTLLTDLELRNTPELKVWFSHETDYDIEPESFNLESKYDKTDDYKEWEVGYKSISSKIFNEMLNNKDFILVDTQAPKQEQIVGTDEEISYYNIVNSGKIPKDKNAKIVLYSKDGQMSRAAIYQLVEAGYTNLYELMGGKDAYDEFLKEKPIQ